MEEMTTGEDRVCSDAQICSLSWVSIGLEPASDGSGRYAHLPRGDGTRTTTKPSPPTVTSGTEAGRTCGRPGAARLAPLRPAGTRPPWPIRTCSRLSTHTLASGGLLCDRRRAAGRVLASSPHGQRAVADSRAGSRDSDRRSGRLTADQSPGRVVSATVTRAGARDPGRRGPSAHRQSASRPHGPRGCLPGRDARARRRVVP